MTLSRKSFQDWEHGLQLDGYVQLWFVFVGRAHSVLHRRDLMPINFVLFSEHNLM